MPTLDQLVIAIASTVAVLAFAILILWERDVEAFINEHRELTDPKYRAPKP